jgi:hypothetical protein
MKDTKRGIPHVTAEINQKGELFCIECADRWKVDGRPMYSDNAALDGETCDHCGTDLSS